MVGPTWQQSQTNRPVHNCFSQSPFKEHEVARQDGRPTANCTTGCGPDRSSSCPCPAPRASSHRLGVSLRIDSTTCPDHSGGPWRPMGGALRGGSCGMDHSATQTFTFMEQAAAFHACQSSFGTFVVPTEPPGTSTWRHAALSGRLASPGGRGARPLGEVWQHEHHQRRGTANWPRLGRQKVLQSRFTIEYNRSPCHDRFPQCNIASQVSFSKPSYFTVIPRATFALATLYHEI